MGNEDDIQKIIDYSGRDFRYIGTRPVRPDGVDKVTGKANFGADFSVNGMIHGRVVRSPHAHAKIKKIRTDKAMKLKGVVTTSSPDPTPRAISAIRSASVPEDTPTACWTPSSAARMRSR